MISMHARMSQCYNSKVHQELAVGRPAHVPLVLTVIDLQAMPVVQMTPGSPLVTLAARNTDEYLHR